MGKGIMAGVLWALDTVVLGIALAMSPFGATEQAVFLAPFVSTFFHDVFSSVWMLIYMGIYGRYSSVIRALKTKKRQVYYARSTSWRSHRDVRLCRLNPLHRTSIYSSYICIVSGSWSTVFLHISKGKNAVAADGRVGC